MNPSTAFAAPHSVLLVAVYFPGVIYALALALSGDGFIDLIRNQLIANALLNSLVIGGTMALVVLPTAFVTAKAIRSITSGASRAAVIGVLFLPLLSNALGRMLAYRSIVSEGDWLATVCQFLFGVPLPIAPYTPAAVLIGLAPTVLPIAVCVCLVALTRMNSDVVGAARNLGVPRLRITWSIELPQCAGALALSAQFCVFVALADTFAQSALGGNQTYTYAAAIVDRVKINDWGSAAALSILLIALVALLLLMVTAFVSAPHRET